MLEKTIEDFIGSHLKARGWLWLKFVSPGAGGVPDRIAVCPGGRIVFVELKTEEGRLSPLQRWMIHRLEELGATVRVVRGKQEAEDFLEEMINGV